MHASPAPVMDRRLTFLFAVAAGGAVANLYWAQPLLDLIADDLGASTTTAGWLVTAAQVGYALGVLLIVPLGDVLDRRRLIPTMLGCSAVALVLCAVSPTIGMLLAAIALLGVTTVSGQLLTPLAGDLADDAQRGHVVGTVASGILTGILASRTVSGLIAGVAGWRAVVVVAAAGAVLLAVLLHRALPPLEPKTRMPYRALIASVPAVALRERTVRWTLVLGMTGFAAFALFWTSLTFLLSGPPFDYSVSTIGLFGLAGLAGAIAAQRVGRLHDRGWSIPATGVAWLVVLLSFALAALAGRSVVLLIVAVVTLDAGAQSLAILNQTRVFAVSHAARSRLNTAFVVSNFIGGGLGSAAATLLWSAGGWPAITVAGMLLSCFALAVWAAGRRGALVVAPARP
ncbi:MFS transporter [Asanoa sp. WMMD1127]|uniref:MFS transporter n=1 Tax=Asanoa sp. WMMD1127 TaxID=3016107 RepID=UPI0024180D65|nr:MFS transporter [Asanoa sp. WMMD1127]MDG4827208.1 MFS transporter [Asanoa sp. WMMD1127]